MMKRIFCLLLALLMLPLLPALAEESNEDILTLQELLAWAEEYKARAMRDTPMNNPSQALTEDGYMFIYEFATLYMDSPVMSADSQVQAIVLYEASETGPRNTRVDMRWEEIVQAFYTENPELWGTSSGAVLYHLSMMPESAHVARVHRDGQRIQTLDYAVYEKQGSVYSDAGLVYTIQDDSVAAIRAYGLNATCEQGTVLNAVSSAASLAMYNGYRQVPVSYTGADVLPLSEEDMSFAGLYFPTLTPEQAVTALGQPLEDTWMEDGAGYLRTMLFDGCEIIFTYDGRKQNPAVDSLMMTSDSLEGPRAVRVGDTLHSVLNRIRHGEGGLSADGTTEVLYGAEGSDTFGLAQYGADASAVLRYGLKTSGGQNVVMYLYFHQLRLNDILLYIND